MEDESRESLLEQSKARGNMELLGATLSDQPGNTPLTSNSQLSPANSITLLFDGMKGHSKAFEKLQNMTS